MLNNITYDKIILESRLFMKLYLSSYKLGNEGETLKEYLKDKEKVLVIPNALDVYEDSERKTNGIIEKCQELEALGVKTEIFDLRNYFGNEGEMRKAIANNEAFYVLGGNVFVLRTAMKLSGFDRFLKEISILPNYVYAGFSAGICVLAPDLHGLDLVDDPNADPYNYGSTIYSGLGLIDFLPVPHFDSPNHPESPKMPDVVAYLENNNLPYKTLRDGEVILDTIENINLSK